MLADPLRLKNPRTFQYIVRELAKVSFQDSNLDSKGAAFEYFVRATLKGKKLGQYFTPRQLIQIMSAIVGVEKIINAVGSGNSIKVMDPACGTGGFLVYLMQESLAALTLLLQSRKITQKTFESLSTKIMRAVFFGSDANNGVACAAKMNMIIAGDGHTNIQPEDSLCVLAENWSVSNPDCDIILTNPPFGTSESGSLSETDLKQYPFRRTKGQLLFLQKMVLCTVSGGDICTVIDEGVLNTDTVTELRKWLFQKCRVRAIVRLPEDTFKPNKINVRASVLYFSRRGNDDIDLDDDYDISFCNIDSLGYVGSGETIRGFEFSRVMNELSSNLLHTSIGNRSGYYWSAFNVRAQTILEDTTCRLDYKYWDPEIRDQISKLVASGGLTVKQINTITTNRGSSPPAELYVDEPDGYALVVKAGSSISKYGELLTGGDYIEKNVYDEMVSAHVFDGDVLLASTGDGTIGKCCVYRSPEPAIADGHVTIIRPDPKQIYPEYLCDYLRAGFGLKQSNRFFSGSTGLVELTRDHVDSIVVNTLCGIKEQEKASFALRRSEEAFRKRSESARESLEGALDTFLSLSRIK